MDLLREAPLWGHPCTPWIPKRANAGAEWRAPPPDLYISERVRRRAGPDGECTSVGARYGRRHSRTRGWAWELEFFRDADGREPVVTWLDNLDAVKREAAKRGLSIVLASQGPAVVGTEYGKNLGDGLFEFRLRIDAQVILQKHAPHLLAKYPIRRTARSCCGSTSTLTGTS